MWRRHPGALAWAFGALLASCLDDSPPPHLDGVVVVSMDYESPELYDAPFPGEHLRSERGTIDVSRAPNPLRTTIVEQIHAALDGIDGFGTTSPIHFQLDGALDPTRLPDTRATSEVDSPILLVDVDPSSPERGSLHPFEATFRSDPGPYAPPNLLTLLPVQGVPLRPRTLYAAVLTDRLRDASGEPVARAPAMDRLLAGATPTGMSDRAARSFHDALDALRERSVVDVERIVAMTVFRTGDPLATMRRAVEATEGAFAAELASPFEAREVFDDYCVFEGALRMPVFQEGEPPYLTEGGAWALDETGAPILQREERARVWVTIPRTELPASGFPTGVLIRTGAGGDRPLVDRGVRDATGAVVTPGTGPALELARAGLAGISVEGPHGGSRNVQGGDEQFLVFNIQNPIALRDNLRQSALELVLLARALETLSLDASSCPGFSSEDGEARFDASRVALFGHSMGASIAPLAAAFEPRFGALVLSGAGASWIENVVHKELPIPTRPLAETLLGYSRRGVTLGSDDPVLGLLQWAGEAADAQVYARLLVRAPEVGAPRHVLMFQGIVDHYILPPIANALTLALGIDLVGEGLDVDEARLAQYAPIASRLWLTGGRSVALPVAGNLVLADGTAVTAVLAQHFEDGVEDGHEVVFQTDPPKVQYRCFLRTFARGDIPVVPDPSTGDAACD